jgi:hypothetical protein
MIKDFVSDLADEEQITKAITRPDWFLKWGYHYLLSLSLAHLSRQCHNYKDKGVQEYGNTLFQKLQDEVYSIFSTIQPPRPALRTRIVTTSMASYVDRSGGCFGPKCRIKLIDGTWKFIEDLDGSELVYQGDGIDGVKIKYITKTKIPDGKIKMCQIDNLLISEFHPFLNSKKSLSQWEFPVNYVESSIFDLDYMYNIVLDSDSAYWVEIEGFKCVSLGHNITKTDSETDFLVHDYFGSHKIIRDLEKFKSNPNDKIIELDNFMVFRDSKTNLVCEIRKI